MLPLELKAGLLVGSLAVLGLWGAIWMHRHDAQIRQACDDAHTAVAAKAFTEHTQAIAEVANEAQRMQNRVTADHLSLNASAARLRNTVAGTGLVIPPAAAASSAPMSTTERLSGELLDSCTAIAGWAECLATSGEACVKSFNALTR